MVGTSVAIGFIVLLYVLLAVYIGIKFVHATSS